MSDNQVQVLMTTKLRDERGGPITALRRVPKPLLAFPKEMLKPGMQGAAEIAFTVLEDGSVADARVITTTHDSYGIAAREDIATWMFEPLAGSGGKAGTQVHCHLTFKTR